MAQGLTPDQLTWGLVFFLNGALVILILWRRNQSVFPFFFFYTVVNLAQGITLFAGQRLWGFNSAAFFKIAWGSQALVSVARALAVAEICRHTLAKYQGIWALGWRLFTTIAVLVLVCSLAVGAHSWKLVVLTAHRGFELAIAVAIFLLFVFAHYYQVFVERAARFLAVGFFLYSSFQVLNDTLLERWLTPYVRLWNFVGMLTFLASLLIWMYGFGSTTTSGHVGSRVAH